MKELVLGSGYKKEKLLTIGSSKEYINPVTLDINPDCNPDIVWDLNNRPLPFEDEEFDEIHAYEILEHISSQGNYKEFFEEFSEYWRILKPGGFLFASCPMWNSIWAFGDPSHTRVISKATIAFLSQKQYKEQCGKTPMSDFRGIYKVDFDIVYANEVKETFLFCLEKR